MSTELTILTYTAAGIGLAHTVLGPDHYLPFIMIAKARNWTIKRTLSLTILCGIGHVFSSVFIGGIGILVGTQIQKITWIESFRGNLAAWALISFGLLYAIWGWRHYLKHGKKTNDSPHHPTHNDSNITPWMLFIIFILGPCEPLIPVLMYPAAHQSIGAMALVTAVFSVTTIGTMTVLVWGASTGLSQLRLKKLEPLGHFLAGTVILVSGMAIQWLGL